ELEELSNDAMILHYAKGERVISQGEEGELMYVVIGGQASIQLQGPEGEMAEVARVSKGEYFGEMALLTGDKRSATVVALDDLELIAIYKQCVKLILEKRPELAEEFSKIILAKKEGLSQVL